MVKVSIIVSVFNTVKYLSRCLESIINQSFRDFEVILVDDGSTDNSGKVCDEYAKNYSYFKVIHKKNEGLGMARNTGLAVASGDYVTFVDSDDYIETNHIENMYLCLRKNDADTCFSGYKKIYSHREDIFEHIYKNRMFDKNEISNSILAHMCGKAPDGTGYIEMSVCMVLLSNSIIKQNNLKFESEKELISEDLIFDLNYYPLTKKVCVSDDVGYCYCDNEDSLTRRYRSDRFEAQKKMFIVVERYVKMLELGKDASVRNKTTFISIARYCVKQEVEFNYKTGRKKAYENIKRICEDDLLISVLNEYRNDLVPLKSRIINHLILNKRTILLWIVEYMRKIIHS